MTRKVLLALMLCLTMAAVTSGCSSSEKSGDEEELSSSDEIPDLDGGSMDEASAMTDDVPMDDLDLPPDGQMADAALDNPDAQVQSPTGDVPPADMGGEPAPVDLGGGTDMTAAEVAPAPVDAATDPNAPTVAESSPETAAAGPVPAPATEEPQQAYAGGSTESYTVQPGDTLMKIAFESTGDLFNWNKIYEANRDKISNPNVIPVGTVLQIERSGNVQIDRNGDQYMIKPGDTLVKISDDVYGTSSKWRQIYENNRQLIKDPNKIFAGFTLYYTMTPAEREEADRLKQNRGAPPPLAEAPVAEPASEPQVADQGMVQEAPAPQAVAPVPEMAPDARTPASVEPAPQGAVPGQ